MGGRRRASCRQESVVTASQTNHPNHSRPACGPGKEAHHPSGPGGSCLPVCAPGLLSSPRLPFFLSPGLAGGWTVAASPELLPWEGAGW